MSYKQINYIKTLAKQSSRKTQRELEEVLLNKETPYSVIRYWIDRLEKEVMDHA